MTPLAQPFTSTGTAPSFGMFTPVWTCSVPDKSVGLSERMASLTMRLGKVLGLDRIPSQRIHANADRLHVRGINARTIPTQMVNDKAATYAANCELVYPAVCANLAPTAVLAAANVKGAVSVLVERQQPWPATAELGLFSDVGHETSFVSE